ncbi:MAG: MarR family transcriptional regulator [Devosia sp.]
MVNKLDDNSFPPLIDHAGWRLGRLFRQWKIEFDAEMVALGHGFMAEARGAVVGHLRPTGAPQAAIAAALGISKQAVQQLVDELEAEGVVDRIPNPDDARGKLVVLTARGAEAIRAGNRVKQSIEQRYRARLGEARFAVFMGALDELYDADGET